MSAVLPNDYNALLSDIRRWAGELGFQDVGIAGIDLADDEAHLLSWLDDGMHGDMAWMQHAAGDIGTHGLPARRYPRRLGNAGRWR